MSSELSTVESDLERIVYLFPEVMKLLFQDMQHHSVCDISIPQRKILHVIYFKKELTMSELSAALGVEMSTATVHIDQLVAAGLVERLRSDTDRRVVKVILTALGQSTFSEIMNALRKNIASVMNKVSPTNQNALRSAFEQLYNILKEGKQ